MAAEEETVPLKAGGPSRAAELLHLLGCKRRSPEEQEDVRQQKYNALLERGHALPEKRKLWYDKLCWWSDAPTKSGASIFALAPRGSKGEPETWIDVWDFVAYCLTKLHQHVVVDGKKYAIVWVQLNNHRLWPLDWRWLRGVLSRPYAAALEGLHVVHPSWNVRLLRLALWPIADDSFWDVFHAHERIEFLDSHMDLRKFKLPKDIYQYDKWLDSQAKEMSEQANKKFGSSGFGGFGGGSMPAEDPKMTEQMAELQRVLEQRGHGKTD